VSRLFLGWRREEQALVRRALKLLSVHAASRELIEVGAYRAGSNPELDMALKLLPALEEFLTQDAHTRTSRAEALQQLRAIVGAKGSR
jgi:flagellum-specific ATP synthase